MRKLCLCCFVIAIVLLVMGCDTKQQTTNIPYSIDATEEELDVTDSVLKEVIKHSNVAFVGEFVSYNKNEQFIQVLNEYTFKVDSVIYGDIPEETVTVIVGDFDLYGFNMNAESFKQGDKYALIVAREECLFEENARYYMDYQMVIPIDDLNNATLKNEQLYLTREAAADIVEYIGKMETDYGHTKPQVEKIFRTESLKEVVEKCDFVFEIEADSIFVEGEIMDVDLYNCRIVKKLKGHDEYAVRDDQTIILRTYKGLLEIGSSYVVAVSASPDKNSLIYHQASNDSIISVDDTQKVDDVISWLKES